MFDVKWNFHCSLVRTDKISWNWSNTWSKVFRQTNYEIILKFLSEFVTKYNCLDKCSLLKMFLKWQLLERKLRLFLKKKEVFFKFQSWKTKNFRTKYAVSSSKLHFCERLLTFVYCFQRMNNLNKNLNGQSNWISLEMKIV